MIHRFNKMHHLTIALGIAVSFVFAGYSLSAGAVTRANADEAYTAWWNLYYNKTNNTFYKRDNRSGLIDFWRYAHDWETVMDRYELTGDAELVKNMKDLWTGFNKTNGTGLDWKQNDFNDDIEWWIISSTRAYMLTKDIDYLTTAKTSFDWLYATQWDNSLGGGIWFGYLAARQLGSGTSWLLTVSGAALANWLEAQWGPSTHRSVGASTAVFTALGLMAAHSWRTRLHLRQRWAKRWAPLVAGTVLLGWLGTAGEGTDIVAHAMGFMVGCAFGAAAGSGAVHRVLVRIPQWLAGLAALASVAVAWTFALAS